MNTFRHYQFLFFGILSVTFLSFATKSFGASWQSVDLRESNLVVTGAEFSKRTQNDISFERFSQKILEMKKKTLKFSPKKARTTTGVSLFLTTDSPEIELSFTLREGENRGSEFAVFQNGKFHQEQKFSKKKKEITLSIKSKTPGKKTLFEITLPSWSNPKLTALKIHQQSKLYTPQTNQPIYVALGDSISHGTGQGSATHKTWPFLLSRQLKMKLCNLAVGGGKISPPVGEMLSSFKQIDLITILVGYNDWNSGITPDEFEKQYQQMLASIRKNHPKTTIICITPTYTLTKKSKRSEHLLEDFRQAVRKAATATKGKQSQMIVIEGNQLTSIENLRKNKKDPVHFSEEGSKLFAVALSKKLKMQKAH